MQNVAHASHETFGERDEGGVALGVRAQGGMVCCARETRDFLQRFLISDRLIECAQASTQRRQIRDALVEFEDKRLVEVCAQAWPRPLRSQHREAWVLALVWSSPSLSTRSRGVMPVSM